MWLRPAEVDALLQACGEVTAGEMETWDDDAIEALEAARDRLNAADARHANRREAPHAALRATLPAEPGPGQQDG